MNNLIDSFYAAIKAADAAALTQCVASDFVLTWQGVETLPWAGKWEGAAGVFDFFAALNAHVQVLEVERLQMFTNAETTMILLRGHWRMKANNKEIHALAANVFKIENERIVAYTVINNSAAFDHALR
jgi:ketosteroid isomerase-like protein